MGTLICLWMDSTYTDSSVLRWSLTWCAETCDCEQARDAAIVTF